jgi:hypothetical protein
VSPGRRKPCRAARQATAETVPAAEQAAYERYLQTWEQRVAEAEAESEATWLESRIRLGDAPWAEREAEP